MPVTGDIQTMPLVELLQWVASNKKTGLLELERNKIRKQISFEQGRVVGCFDDDPSMRLGQFLISLGKITDQTLQSALLKQRTDGGRIPEILIEMDVLTKDEIAEQVKNKALETIYGVFEWSDAIFRFEQNSAIDRYEIAVDLSVEGILLEGATREDELGRIRGTFSSSGVVLRRTDEPIPDDADNGPLMTQLLELVDGERSLAEILTRAHASEFHVLKLLFDLKQTQIIEIAAEREVDAGAATLLDMRTDATPVPLPSLADFSVQPDPSEDDTQLNIDRLDAAFATSDTTSASPAGDETQDSTDPSVSADLHTLLEISAAKMESGDSEGALDVLDACYKSRPHDESLRQQMERTEAACLEEYARGPLQTDRVPQRIEPEEEHGTGLQPDQMTLLGMIDDERSIQSLLWVAPLREIQVFRALQQLLDLELIRVVDGPTDSSAADHAEEGLEEAIYDTVSDALDFDGSDAH